MILVLSLTKELEHNFEYGGKKYPINFAFDNVLRFYELVEDDSVNEPDKLITAFQMFFPDTETANTDLIVEGVQSVAQYIQQEPYGNQANTADSGVSTPRKYYSFTQDAEAIYASFLSQYGVDLIQEQGHLHWDKFKAMLMGLEEKTVFRQIIEIRTRDTSEMEGKELQSFMEVQSYYTLDENKSVEADNTAMADVFTALKGWATK